MGVSCGENLKYVIFSGRNCPENYLGEYNSVYKAWHKGWVSTFEELKSEAIPTATDFLRQNIVGGVFHEDTVIGLQCYSFFQLGAQSHLDHSYFKTYPQQSLDALRVRGLTQLMTMEYLYVNPDWRRSLVGFSLADIICTLGLRIFKMTDAQALISITRNQRKVNDMLYNKGAYPLCDELTLHNVGVDIICFEKEKVVDNQTGLEASLTEKLWNQKQDVTEGTRISKVA